MRIAIANFSAPHPGDHDFRADWARRELPARPAARLRLFDQRYDWGFHIFALGVHLLDRGVAGHVEFWDFAPDRRIGYHESGVLRIRFQNEADLAAYLDRYGPPDLFVNHGRHGRPVLDLLAGRSFRVHVAALRGGADRAGNSGAECYLVDSEEFLDARSMMYIPVVNTRRIHPIDVEKVRDFIYLASCYPGKRQDLLIDAVRGTPLTGHLHPVDGTALDLSGTHITTSRWDERDVIDLLRTSRIAVYAGDVTSNPAAMWECVAAGLPIVVNSEIRGGKHLVIPGETGELAAPHEFREVMERVLADRRGYRPREYFDAHWDTEAVLDRYLAFFARMGWSGGSARTSGAFHRLRRELPLKLGFLNILYSKRVDRGGLGEHIADLSRELARLGQDVTVLTSGTGRPTVEDGVTVVPLGRVDRFTRPGQLANPAFALRRLAYMRRAASYIQEHRFDLIEAADGGFEHLFLLGRRDCAVVVKLHGDFRHIHPAIPLLTRAMQAFEGAGLRRSDALYASSSGYAQMIAAEHGIPRESIPLIPCGVALGMSGASWPSLVERCPMLAGRRLVLLSVGASPGRKGAAVFVEAARRVHDPSVLFVLISSRPVVAEAVSPPPPNLLSIQPLKRGDFHALMAASEIVVLPSEFESFSITTYEAMLLGRAVVVSKHVPLEGPAREYPRMLTLDRLDGATLAGAIDTLLSGRSGLAEMGRDCLEALRNTYGIERIASDTLDLYRKIVARFRAGSG